MLPTLFLLLPLTLALDPWDIPSLPHHVRSLYLATERFPSPYAKRQTPDCIPAAPANTVTDRLQAALQKPGDTLALCPGQEYLILQPINFTASDQEIYTLGYPTDDSRACLTVNGVVANGTGHTTAINAQCVGCDRAIVRNIQVNGTRHGAIPTSGGANLEMGGPTSGQLVEYVHSFDPRSWSCLHIAEGPFTCNNASIINNDIGPCGSDLFMQWADGISLSCRNSHVAGNFIDNPTDGGIVVFGSPGSLVENNTIWVTNNTLLGGLNMVDYLPWDGDFTGTVVQNNLVVGGLATEGNEQTATKGDNDEDVIVKIGLAVGPRTWFGDHFRNNVSRNGVARNNIFSGAFGYGIAVSSAENFTIIGNSLSGNTSFIGSRGPNCSADQILPAPEAFVWNITTTLDSTLQPGFADLDVDSLTCIQPVDGAFWPFGGEPVQGTDQAGVPNAEERNSTTSGSGSASSAGASAGSTAAVVAGRGGLSSGAIAALVIGILTLVLILVIAFFCVRRARAGKKNGDGEYFADMGAVGLPGDGGMGMKQRLSW
ncbi:hypothetical protein DACRYDRAFT_73816 [Dacryopinax primogenitus]|uniref:Uncharacterized protein n=1 Tax=Dacryopinax primogenitus (strain DJM 731) TaxID=1858805 RepID=M5GFK1_DACPD|nr:uncharacterized protein DACRYDRAFT_73816 [Dacryopinax primogenitus]EJU06387.1 hypothetical protein DACRYDRAFT_73816 [Dacryopinax primogenitus]